MIKYKVYVTHSQSELHPVFKAKLNQYKFQKLDHNTYYLPDPITDMTAVVFYQRNIEGPQNPLKVSLKKA